MWQPTLKAPPISSPRHADTAARPTSLPIILCDPQITRHPAMYSTVYEDINKAVENLQQLLDNRSQYSGGEENKRVATALRSMVSTDEPLQKKRRIEPEAQLELVLPALPLIKDLLDKENDASLIIAAVDIFGTITKSPKYKGIEAVQAVPGLMSCLATLLGHDDEQIKTAAVHTVNNMLLGSDTQVRCCVDAGCVEPIISILQSDCDEHLLDTIDTTISIFTHTYSIQRALEKGILTTLRNVLEDTTTLDLIKRLRMAICKFCSSGTTKQRAQLESSDFLKDWCYLLGRVWDKRALYIMDGINALIKAAERDACEYDSDLGPSKAIPNLFNKLKKMDVLGKIKQLSEMNERAAKCRQARELKTAIRFHLRGKDCVCEDGKIFTPEEIVKEMKSRRMEEKVRGGRAARRMVTLALSQGEGGDVTRVCRILDVMVKARAIASLEAAIFKPNDDLQYDAVWTLASITHIPKYIPAVIKVGAISTLVLALYQEIKVSEKAAITLGNIASHGAETTNKVLSEQGAVAGFLRHIKPETPLNQLRSFVLAFEKLVGFSQSKSAFEFLSPALPHISKLLGGIADERVLVHACIGLSVLTNSEEERIEAVQATEGLMANLVDLLKHEAAGVQEAALKVLLNILAGSSTQVDRCLDAGCLNHIVRLLQSNERSVVQGAVSATNYIFSATPSQIQRALDKDILTPLHNILAAKTSDCRAKAAESIANLCSNGSAAQRQKLVSSDLLEPYCALLAVPDNDVVGKLLDGLDKLLETNHDDFKGEALRSRLKELGVRGQIETISKSSSTEGNTKACRLLETYPDF